MDIFSRNLILETINELTLTPNLVIIEQKYCVLYVCYFIHEWARQVSQYRDSLRAGRSGDRIPVGARFFAPAQTGPGAHPASYTMGTGSFPGVKRSGCGTDHPPLSCTKVEGRIELYICSPSGPSWPVLG
jgi:hypothetical protein